MLETVISGPREYVHSLILLITTYSVLVKYKTSKN
jgi:hypothetical protein